MKNSSARNIAFVVLCIIAGVIIAAVWIDQRRAEPAHTRPAPDRESGSTIPATDTAHVAPIIPDGQKAEPPITAEPVIADPEPDKDVAAVQAPESTRPEGPASERAPMPVPGKPRFPQNASELTVSLITESADTAIPLKTRIQSVRNTARKGTPDSVESVMALGDAGIYLSYTAIESLGEVNNPSLRDSIGQYLEPRLSDPDCQISRAAIEGYAKQFGTSGAMTLAAAIGVNQERPDGYEAVICTRIVQLLAEFKHPGTEHTLTAELAKVPKGVWGIGYGSEVVKALGAIGTETARETLTAYADRLSQQVPDDPLARQYYESMIAEARALAAK